MASAYSKGVSVNYNSEQKFNPYKPWEVLDDGFCYSRHATEEEAKDIAKTLVGQKDVELRFELDFEEMAEELATRYCFTLEQAKHRIRELVITY